MGANDKAAATFHPLDDEFADALVGENPRLPVGSVGSAVIAAMQTSEDIVRHGQNLQAAVNDIREIHGRRPLLIRGTTVEKWKCGTCDTEYPCPTAVALNRNHV